MTADTVSTAWPGDLLGSLPLVGTLDELLADRRYRTIVMGSSKDPNAKVTVLFLPTEGPSADRSGAGLAAMAVKVPTTDVAARAVAAEAELLAALQAGGDDPILRTVPAPLGAVAAGDHLALAVGVLGGEPMATGYHRWRHTASPRAVGADFAAAATWLVRFQEATAGPARTVADAGLISAGLRARFAAEPGPVPDLGPDPAPLVEELCQCLASIDRRLSAQTTRASAVHGDYWFGNLLVDGPGGPVCGAVDWEAGTPAGSPLRDLTRFAVSYALYLDRHTPPGRTVAGHRGLRAGEWGAGLLFAVGGSGWFGRLFGRFLSSGLSRLGIDAVTVAELAVMGLCDVAATADHDGFARQHLRLAARIAGSAP
jgi:hypothetical protein